MNGTVIIGAGGHAKVVADILLCQEIAVLGYVDDNPSLWHTELLGLPVLGGLDLLETLTPDALIIAIGNNAVRQAIAERLGPRAARLWRGAIHPRATVSQSVQLGDGAVIAAGAIVNPAARIGKHVIINTGATVDHDCVIADYAHIAPGAHLAGGVSVGQQTLIGVGAAVNPSCTIGAHTIIGAGAVVVCDIPDRVTAMGVPARWSDTQEL